MQRPTNTKLDEHGFASIVIALILIIVLALFTIGFAQLARREQQTALDSQKATQAQYAAESGINNAYKDILSGKITKDNASGTNCMKAGAGPTNLQPFTNVDLLTKPRAKVSNSGVSTGGTVQATFKTNAGGAITESGDKVPADATFHYISPLEYAKTETVTFEARSKRGTGKLDYTLTTSPHAD